VSEKEKEHVIWVFWEESPVDRAWPNQTLKKLCVLVFLVAG